MARTRAQLRELVVSQLGLPFISGTADEDAGDTNTLIDTPDLQQYRDDALIGGWVFISDGSPNLRHLQITNSTQSDGSVNFIPTLSANLRGRAYEVLPFSGIAIHQSIDSAATLLFDQGILVREFAMKGLVVGSPIYNASFDLWGGTTAVEGWIPTGAGATQTRERDSGNIGMSETSMGLASGSSSEGRLELNHPWRRYLFDMKGQILTFYCWVKSSTTSHARIGLGNGSSITYSDYHSGDGDWELLSVEYDSSKTDTDLIPLLSVATTAKSYFSDCWIGGGGTITEYPWPIVAAPDGPSTVRYAMPSIDKSGKTGGLLQIGPYRSVLEWQFYKSSDMSFPSATTTQRGSLTLPPGLPDGARLRIMAEGPFTLLDGETETMEVTLPESELVAKVAAKSLLERQLLSVNLSTRKKYIERMGFLERDIDILSGGHGQSSDVATFGPMMDY
jgi:hypothetical protein